MRYIETSSEAGKEPYIMRPKTSRARLWQLVDITPEISNDPHVTGARVPSRTVRRLRSLLKEQRALIMRVVGI